MNKSINLNSQNKNDNDVSNKHNSKKTVDDNLIQLYIAALDKKNKEVIEFLYNLNNKYNIENDIVYEMYNINELNSERFQFIIENCTVYLNITSSLIKKLMKDNNKELLEILFKNHLKFFDNKYILNLLKYYKSRTPISDSDLYTELNNDKYKIPTKLKDNFEQYDSSYYLFNACESGNEAAVQFLIEHGAELTIKDKYNRIALDWACESGNLHLVKYLLHLGANINNENNFGVTHIFNACYSGNLNLVKYLVEHGLDINKKNNDGMTPLFFSCFYGHINVVKYLIELGTNINIEDKVGYTPLFYACENGHEDIVKYLVEHGADISKKSYIGNTALEEACWSDNLDLVKYLVELGADINKKDLVGWTPLLKVCFKGHEDIVKYLVERGVDIHQEGIDGRTPLFYACQKGHENIVKYLVKHGANINKEDISGKTPLFFACQKGHENIVKYLVEHGADIHKVNYKGETPLLISKKSGHKNIGNYLIKIGASKNIPKIMMNKSNKGKGKENSIKGKENINKKINEMRDLAIVLYDFHGTNSDELTFHKDDILIFTNWKIKEGWAIGYKRNNPYKQGIFPSALVRKYLDNEENVNTFMMYQNSNSINSYAMPLKSSYSYSPYSISRWSSISSTSRTSLISESPRLTSNLNSNFIPTAPRESIIHLKRSAEKPKASPYQHSIMSSRFSSLSFNSYSISSPSSISQTSLISEFPHHNFYSSISTGIPTAPRESIIINSRTSSEISSIY